MGFQSSLKRDGITQVSEEKAGSPFRVMRANSSYDAGPSSNGASYSNQMVVRKSVTVVLGSRYDGTSNVFDLWVGSTTMHGTLKRVNDWITKSCRLAQMRVQIALLILAIGCPYSLGQATSTASRDGMIQVGIGGTYGSPDYNPKGIGGLTYYAGIDFHYFGLEADIHQTTLWTPYDLGQRTYVGGPRFVYPVGRYRPYVRGVLGFGQFGSRPGTGSNQFGYGHIILP